MKTFSLHTRHRNELVDITGEIRDAVRESGVSSGICVVYCPHTTAAVTINENADPSVGSDLLMGLSKIVPTSWPYRHSEGNSDAHLKSSMVGCSERIIVDGGALVLGTWQGIYFCEFDGPRSRKVHVQIVSNQK